VALHSPDEDGSLEQNVTRQLPKSLTRSAPRNILHKPYVLFFYVVPITGSYVGFFYSEAKFAEALLEAALYANTTGRDG
jgi:hypothetical protein